MTKYTWSSSTTNSAWATRTNWSPKGVPGSRDSVTIGTNKHGVYPNITTNDTIASLTIDSGATLTIGSATLIVSNSVTDNGTLTGYGTVTVNGSNGFKGSGILEASGGTLTINSSVATKGKATKLEIANGSTLDLTGHVGSYFGAMPTLTFLSNVSSIFQDTSVAQTNVHLGTISGFSGSDKIELQTSLLGGDTIGISGNSLTIYDFVGVPIQTYTFASGTDMAAINFTSSNGVDTLTICFMAGTMIATPDGEAAIETLRPGDLVLTSEGATKPVNWIGMQTISTRFADPIRNLPIRVKAGALAENTPARDLLISPDHALLVDGVLISAGALVNGSSIIRETNVPEVFIYYHVELDDHSLILAENAPAETFVDNVDRRNFDNWAEFEALYPEGKEVKELPYPRVKAHRQVPVYVRVALADRAQAIGTAVSAVA